MREALAQDVLPVLPEGVASRQLKSALHLLARLERTTQDPAAYLRAENHDVAAVLMAILERMQAHTGDSGLAAAGVAEVRDTSPSLADQTRAHRRLTEMLATVDRKVRDSPRGAERQDGLEQLYSLYARILDRQDDAWGTTRRAEESGQ